MCASIDVYVLYMLQFQLYSIRLIFEEMKNSGEAKTVLCLNETRMKTAIWYLHCIHFFVIE